MELIVTRADNSNYNLPSENSKITSAVQTRTLMGEDTVVMTVQSVGYINFLIGDWIEVFGRKYTLNTLGEPQRIGENTFEYNLVFEGVNYELTKVVYRSADYSGFNPTSDFPLTGTAESFLTVLQYNLDRAFGQGVWAIGSFPATEAKTLSFVSENCLLALNRVCSEFGLEYEIKIIGGVKTINLGAVGDTLPLNLEYGKGKGLYSLTRTNVDSKNIVTRLYVEGSDRNVKAGYRDNALRLRIAANAESYIDSASAASFGIIEGSKIFDDIFPHREGTVSAINANDLLEFTDSGMDFDLAETDTNGTKWLIAGQSAKIHFNTGALAGYEFELTAYNHATKTFKIKPFKDERGLQFPNPDSAAFQIKTGDKYVILDIIMPDAYIQAAEAELLARGQEYLSQNDQPRVEYSLDLDRFFLKSMFSGPGFEVNFLDAGDYLHIKDSKIGVDKEVRVKTFTRDVLDPWVYQVSLSDVIEPTRIELLLADTLETKKAARQSKLFDPARSRRNWRDVEEVAGMVDTLRAEVALIGSPEGQFQIDSFFEINKGGNPDSFGATAGVLAHDAFEGDAGSVWNIGAFDVALSNSGSYYLYAQCSRVNAGAVFTVSLTKIGVEDVPGYYHFPVGIISSVKDDARTLTTVYGYTLVSGNNITTGIIQNDQSGIMINLQTGEIRGAFTFTNGQLVESVVNTKNSRYTQGTDPSVSWTTLEEKQKHVDDIWAKILADGIEEYVYTEVSVGVYEWVLNETEIDGGRIKAGTIDASRIDVTGLFAEEINATNFRLEKGRVGAFEVDTVLKSENEEGKGIYINPSEYEIAIENKSEGFGVSSVNMKAGSLTPYLLLAGGTSGTYRTTVNSNELTTSLTSAQTRATGGVDLPPIYMGRSTSAQGRTSVNAPTGGNRISLAKDKNYSVDLRYLFNVYHSGGSANGETYKLQGALKVSAVATLYGVTAEGVTKVLGTKAAPVVTIERSDKRTGNDFYPITIKTAFSSQDCIYAYWKLDVNLKGDLTYQRWSNDYLWKYYWETKTDWAIDYKHSMGALSSFYPSVGVTELTTSGFQTVWATNRYFRIDGEDSGAFIRSAGVWMHNGYEVATANDINTITADLTNYVLINDLQSAYYNKTQSDALFALKENHYDKTTSDGRFAKKAGDGAQDFNVKDLIIHGQVNQWLAQQLVVDDARIQVNRKQGGAVADSGLVIYDKDTSAEVSRLVYDVNGIWRAGGEAIATKPWVENSATAYNAARLGGVVAASYLRSDVVDQFKNLYTGYRWTSKTDGIQFGIDGINGGLAFYDGENPYSAAIFRDTDEFFYVGVRSGETLRGIVMNKDGWVGFGIAPTERLHVAGNGRFTGNLTAVNAALSGTLGVAGATTLQSTLSVAQAAIFGGNVGTSNFVSQMLGWRVTPQGQADFRHIYTDELQAKAFTADISQALVGSDVLTKSVAKLAQNWATTANGATSTIYVEELEGFPDFQVFAVGDRLLLRLFDRSGGGLLIKNIWATVASYVSTTKNVQRYTITVNSGGAAGHTVYAGSMILDYGTPGSGVIERTVLDQQGSPYSRVSTWVNNPWTPGNYTLHYQSGNLNGIPNTEGWGVYSENSFLTGKLLVGDLTKVGQYMEYENGQLNIKGKITVTGGNAATKEDVDAVQVGGRNYLKGSAKFDSGNWFADNTSHISIESSDENGINQVKHTSDTYLAQYTSIIGFDFSDNSQTFTISVYAKCEQSGTIGLTLSAFHLNFQPKTLTKEWAKYTWTFKGIGSNLSGFRFRVPSATEENPIYIKKPAIFLGNKATDWTPAPEDVDAGIAATQSAADTANALISDIASDSKLTASEKKAVRKEWEIIAAEYASIMPQLISFGVSTNNFNAAFYQLGTYLNNGINWTTGVPVWISDAGLGQTTDIDGALFRSHFKAYYDQRTKALNAIAAKNKESVDALDYLAEAMEGDTTIEGGLVTTNVLMVKDTNGAVRGGMSGLKSDNIGFWTGGTYQDAVNDNANIIFRKDGSFSLAGGKISGTSAGALSVDGGVVAGVIESQNWDGTVGSSFDLNNGRLLIGDAIRLSGDLSEIQVKNRDTGLDSFRIGDFSLTPTGFADAGVDVTLSGVVTTPAAAGSYQLNSTVYVSGTGVLTASASNVSSSLLVGGSYHFSTALKVTLTTNMQVATEPYFRLDKRYERIGGNGIKMQLKNGNVVVWEQNISTIPDNGVIPLSVFTSFQAVSQFLQLIITIDGEYQCKEPYSEGTRLYNTSAIITRFDSSSRLVLQPLLARMEFSTKGMQAVFSSSNYFRCDGTAIEGRGIQTFISPDGSYRLRISNDGIEKGVMTGGILSWTTL